MTSIKCQLCGITGKIDNFFTVHNKNDISYECVNDKQCRARNSIETIRIQTSGIGTKEEQILEFGIKFEDLIEYPQRYRDGSIHYDLKPELRTPNCRVRYSWYFCNNYWYYNKRV